MVNAILKARYMHGCAVLDGRDVLIAGGFGNEDGGERSVELLDVQSGNTKIRWKLIKIVLFLFTTSFDCKTGFRNNKHKFLFFRTLVSTTKERKHHVNCPLTVQLLSSFLYLWIQLKIWRSKLHGYIDLTRTPQGC